MNLLKETVYQIENRGHTVQDIIFIGSEISGYQCTWDEYKILANFDYDNGYGGQEVATDLMIAFNDGSTLRRDEYDGAEWWDYVEPFKMPTENHKILTLKNNFYNDSLKSIHENEVSNYDCI